MKCPFCHEEINNPEPWKHLQDCMRQEQALWQSRFDASLAEMRARHLQEAQ